MERQQILKKKGIVLREISPAMYLVKDISSEEEFTVVLSGKMRMNYLRLKVGQLISFEVSPYDSTRGRFIYK
ncbi:MAG: translation initiation factor IF-1 [Chitinophagales bacterium]